MKEQLYIVSYDNINYIFTQNELVQEKINNKKLLINEELLKYYNINDKNINQYKTLINNIIKDDNFKVINYSIYSSITIYKLRYIIKKYIDSTLEYDKQHISININTNYNKISDIIFKLFGNNKEKIIKKDLIDFFKLIGFTFKEDTFVETNTDNYISYNNISKYLLWDDKNINITLGFEIINKKNNSIFFIDSNFIKKNINNDIFNNFTIYNTNNKTINDYIEENSINNYIINVTKYNIIDNYSQIVKQELNKYNISFNEEIDILYSKTNNYNLEKINFINCNVQNVEITLNNTINIFNLLQELNKINVSEIIPFIRSKNNKNIVQYKIYIKNDIPYIDKEILESWINEENESFKINSINIKSKYLNLDEYYNIIISQEKISFYFNNNKLLVNDIKLNIDYILSNILKVNYNYSLYNPLFTIRKCNLLYNYNINNINYNIIYLKLLFIISIFYTDTILDDDFLKENISKINNIKEIKCYYKKSLNYKYPIDEMNILRNAKSIKQKKIELKKLKENIKYNFDIEEQLYKSARGKININILYNNNNIIFTIKNLLNFNKLNDLNYIFNKYLLLISNDVAIYNLYNIFNINKIKEYESNIYNNILENSSIYYNLVNKLYPKLNIKETDLNISDVSINNLDNFFDDIIDINYSSEIIIPEFEHLINDKNKTILNINNGEYIFNNLPKQLLDNINIKNNKLKILNYDNDSFKILLCLINLFIKTNYKENIITFIEIYNSIIFDYLNKVKLLFTLEKFIEKIVLVTDYIKLLNISIIDNIRHKILNNNIIEIYLYILDYEFILNNRNIIKYNKEIYKDFGFIKYNQYNQICEAKRQPIAINKNLYKILLSNDDTGSVNRLFKNSNLTKYVAGKFFICLSSSTIEGKQSLLPIIDNITDNTFSICCHTFDHKEVRKSNLQDIKSNKHINFTNTYMLPYNIANISSDEIVKSIGYEINKQKTINNIYNISVLLRVGIPINNNYSLFVNSILFALGKENITQKEFINDIVNNITYRRYQNLNNGSVNYIFNNDISQDTTLESLISQQREKNTLKTTTQVQTQIQTQMNTQQILTETDINNNVKKSYNNFITYISKKIKYIDYEFGVDLISKMYNINIVIFSYNISNVIQTELICPLNINEYNFTNKKTIILLKINENNILDNKTKTDDIYELIISYNKTTGYKYLFDLNDNYFKKNILNKLIEKCQINTNNNLYLKSLLYDNNPNYIKISNKILQQLNIEYNVVDNYNILVGFIIKINTKHNLFIPINPLIDNINKKKSKSNILFSNIVNNAKYIHTFEKTIQYLKLLNIDIFNYNNHILLDNLNINVIGIVILTGKYIPIKSTSIKNIDINEKTIITELDEYIINNIIYNNDNTNIEITNNYNIFKKNIGKKLLNNNKLKKNISNSLLTNNIETIYLNLSNAIKNLNMKVDNNYIEYLSYELLHNYIIRNEILNYVEDSYEDITLIKNTLILQEKELQDIGLNSIYKSFYFNNNNLYTGNLYNDKILYLDNNHEQYNKLILNCNNLIKITNPEHKLYNKLYYKFTIIKQVNTIIYYSDCIYYNLSNILLKEYNITKLRQSIFNYIKDNKKLKKYLYNVSKETNNLIYNDIINYQQLEYVLLSNNHWITTDDLKIISIIYNINILIIDNENNTEYIINENIIDNYIILYKETFYHKRIYYLVYNDNNCIFTDNDIFSLFDTQLKNISIIDSYNTETTNEINKYVYDLDNNLYSIINLIEEEIIDKLDITNIINEFVNIWKLLPFKDNEELIKILNKIDITKKIIDIYKHILIQFYPSVEINEQVIYPPFNHLNILWNIRQNKNIYNIFKEIYNTKNLLVSLDSFTIIFNRSQYFKIHSNLTDNNIDDINSFIALTNIKINYINNINYINTIQSKLIKISDNEYRIPIKDIDTSYINSIDLEPGMLFILSNKLLYFIENNNNYLGIILHLSYFKQETSKYSMKEREESYINGTNLQNELFNMKHYNSNDKNRLYNLFDIKIYKDGGKFLYNSYFDFNKESPIIYRDKIKQLNQYNPTKVLCNKSNYNEIELKNILSDTSLNLNKKINTLYSNNISINNLSKLGIQLLLGK